MRKRVLVWGGAAVAVVTVAALIIYFVRVGLDDADKLASVLGLFVAAAGLAVAVHGLRRDRARPDAGPATIAEPTAPTGPATTAETAEPPGKPEPPRPNVSASGTRSVAVGGDNSGIISTGDGTTNIQMRAEASGGGRVYQAGGDQTINES
ncbi:hypothetical protein ACWEPC_00070 [Nonomuraea sp. NPDC004297]